MNTVGERLGFARTRKGFSRVKLGKLVGRSTTAVIHWEDGTSRIKLDDAVKVCKALGVSLDWLSGWKEEL